MRAILLILAGLLLAPPAAHAQSALETVSFILLRAQKVNKRLDLTESGDTFRYVNRHSDRPEQNTDVVITRVSDCLYTITGILARSPVWRGKVDWEVDFSGMYAIVPEKRPFGPGLAPNDNFELKGVKVCGRPTSPPFPPRPPDTYEGVLFTNFPPAGQCRTFVETATLYMDEDIQRMALAINYFRTNFCKGRAF